MAERAGFTVTMFLVDVSPSMGKTRLVHLPDGPDGEERAIETTNLQWSLQFVKLKIQEMIYNGRKTDQCGVILFGTEDTENIINDKDGGYDHVTEFIPIGQPNAGTLAKLSALEASTEVGDPIDALIVGIETQDRYLTTRKKWTRKIVLLTDGENSIEVEDWEATVKKMNALNISLTIVGVDFDDDELPFHEEDKSIYKRENEEFFHTFVSRLVTGVIGNCQFALEEIARPDIKQTKSALLGTELRIGDTSGRPDEGVKISVKASKCTALARPKSWKKFGVRPRKGEEENKMDVDGEDGDADGDDDADAKRVYVQLAMRTEYFVETEDGEGDKSKQDDDSETEDEDSDKLKASSQRVEREQLIRGFKYGSSFAPCPEGSFPHLPPASTKKGIDICGFFPSKQFRRDQAMGEVQYIWADPDSAIQQVAMSSLVQAMYEKGSMAIARWVSRDGMDPKMGVLKPMVFDNVDCFLWVRMPFADDVRKYTFSSLDNLVNKKGESITKHPYIPTDEQVEAMEEFVDAMDLMEAGEKDEEGVRQPWFDTRLSYNPAVHRTKQALFHGAVVHDLNAYPVPPPHPELLKYFNPPKRVVKRARDAVDECKKVFKVKEVPKRKIVRVRKDGHVPAQDEDEEMLLLDKLSGPSTSSKPPNQTPSSPSRRAGAGAGRTQANSQFRSPQTQSRIAEKKINAHDSASETESEEDEEDLLLNGKSQTKGQAQTKLQVDSAKKKKSELKKSSSSYLSMPPPALPPSSPPRPDADEGVDSPSQSQTDYGRAPGRIIGSTYPLADFRRNIITGDLVSKAVEDFGWVIKDIVLRPFTSRRNDELVECLRVMRRICLEEDEVDAWNGFLQDLKKSCLSGHPGNMEFWGVMSKLGRNMSLITKGEAGKFSDVQEATAVEFMRMP